MDGTHFAVLGDLHSNGPALDACLAAIAQSELDSGLCTGDLVMRGSSPEHCVRAIRDRGWPCALGNTDRKVVNADDQRRLRDKGDRVGNRWWSRRELSPKSLRFLAALPMVSYIEVAGRRIALLHGGPDDPTDALDCDSSDAEFAAVGAALDADCVVSGHTHRAFVREVGGRLFLNPGSVGESRDDDLRPAWARLVVDRQGMEAHLERVDRPLAVHRP